MQTIGERLEEARKRKGISIREAAETTKIRGDYLQKFEANSFAIDLPPLYIRGFVRTYATMLKLDVPRVIAELHEELGRTKNFSEPPPLTTKTRSPLDWLMLQFSRLNWRIALAGVAVLLLLGLGAAIYRNRTYQPEDPLKDLGPGIYQAAPNAPGDTLPLPTNAPPRSSAR